MTTPILVTGGTGNLGRRVVKRLRDADRAVRVLSRSTHTPQDGIDYLTADLATGEGVDAALEGVEIVMHLAGSAKGDADKARTLVEAAAASDVRHLIYISVVGADRIPVASGVDRAMFGYFEAKLAAEHIVEASGIPFTILRATQFHDLTLKTAEAMAKMPLVPVPSGFKVQPVDAGEVAARLVELALGEPAGHVPDLAGPHVYDMDALVRDYLRANHRWRPIMRLPLPGKAARAYREGANLAPERAVGRKTWEEFLSAELG